MYQHGSWPPSTAESTQHGSWTLGLVWVALSGALGATVLEGWWVDGRSHAKPTSRKCSPYSPSRKRTHTSGLERLLCAGLFSYQVWLTLQAQVLVSFSLPWPTFGLFVALPASSLSKMDT